MTVPDLAARVDVASPLPFEPTLRRLVDAIAAAGMELFACIDHAANARAVGLDMPASTVLIYGKAAGGTPVMLASPASALDLPLRVLVREDADGRAIVSFHPIGPSLVAAGVQTDLAARLGAAQDVLRTAIQP